MFRVIIGVMHVCFGSSILCFRCSWQFEDGNTDTISRHKRPRKKLIVRIEAQEKASDAPKKKTDELENRQNMNTQITLFSVQAS
jgi:hypothetical protein